MAPRDEETDGYGAAWAEIGRALEEGTSWSGHERDRAWRSGPDGFTDVSAVWGMDSVEDGRVALRVDWDGDGDDDLWLRYRSGPTLRYFENRTERRGTWIEVDGMDAHTSIVALEADVVAPGAEAPRTFHAAARPVSDGYLAASRTGFTLRAPEGGEVVAVRVIEADGGVRDLPPAEMLGQGPGYVVGVELSAEDCHFGLVPPGTTGVRAESDLEPGPLPTTELPWRVVLRTPLGLPTERVAALRNPGEPRLVLLTSETCLTCEAVVPVYMNETADLDAAPAVHRITLEDQTEAREGDFFAAIGGSVLGPGVDVALPFGALIGPDGALQAIYTGDLDAAEIALDAQRLARTPGAERHAFGGPGDGPRWFHAAPRSFAQAAAALRRAGLDRDADVYSSGR